MERIRPSLSLISAIAGLICLGCANPDATNPSPSPQNLTPSARATRTETPSSIPNQESSKSNSESPKTISVGDIIELEDNRICGKSKVIYAYGETSNYKVYICANEKEPDRPRYYISRNKDGSGGLEMEAINYNPQQAGAIEFKNDGYVYALESPTTQNPEPVLRIAFPNGNLNKEQLLRYLSRTNSSNPTKSNSGAEALRYVLQNRENLGVCQDNFRSEDGQKGMGSRAFQISDKKYLVQVQCFLAAYQGAFEYVLWIDESPKPKVINLEFDGFQEGKNGEKPRQMTERTIAGAPRFNTRSQTMTNFTKFRGVGDCGSAAVYKLEGDRMVLKEYRAKYECDGKYVQDFPIIYP